MQEIINLLVHSSTENLNPVKHEKNLKILVDVCNDLLSQIVNYIGPNQKNNNKTSIYSIMFPKDSITKEETIDQ